MDRTTCGACGAWIGDDELQDLREEVECLRAENRSLRAAQKICDDELQDLREEVECLRAENRSLRAAQKICDDELQDLREEVECLRAENRSLRAAQKICDDELQDLREEVERLHELEGTVRILSAAQTTLIAERESLRAFCRAIMREWPNGEPDGGEIQDAAVECGLLTPRTVTEPCGEYCQCAEYCAPDELAEGVTCYKKVEWLVDTGPARCEYGNEQECER